MTAPAVYLETFGCQMNVLDSQLVRGQLQALGYRFTDDWTTADVVLYNTCSVREHAEQKVWSRVGEVGLHKKAFPGVLLGVIGCMAERDGQNMLRKFPQVDLICGPGELDKIPHLIDNARKTSRPQAALQGNTHRRSATLAAAEDELELLDLSRAFDPDQTSGSASGGASGSAYVRITRGCNKFCTYCVVPHTRGREVHRHPDHIVEECRKLVAHGTREITLLGQTVNHYHYDTSATVTIRGVHQPQVGAVVKSVCGPQSACVTTFAQLLARIHDEIPDLLRLRFVTSFPRDFGDDILRVMADRPRICRYLHLPVQSASNRLLKLMNRGYEVEEYLDLLRRVRHYLPGAELATDIICGFPTETEDDHAATMDLLRRGGFKNAFIFKYSPRPGTAAHDRFDDDVPPEVKKRRNNELLAVQSQVSAAVHAKYVGREVEVFVEQVSAKAQKAARNAAAPGSPSVTLGWEKPAAVTQLSGRTDTDLIVCFEGDPALIGDLVRVRIDRATPLTLFGTPAPAALPV